jgi:hypothetical protein
LAIAVAASSVNSSSHEPVSSGRSVASRLAATVAPQSRPSTRIGTATVERIPSARAASATVPVASSKASNRTSAPVSSTGASTLSPSRVNRVPSGTGSQGVSDWATSVAAPSGSKRSIPIATSPAIS